MMEDDDDDDDDDQTIINNFKQHVLLCSGSCSEVFLCVCVPPVSPLWRINLMSNDPTVETSNLTSDTRLDLSPLAANANVITCTEQRCLGFKEPNMIPQFIRKKHSPLNPDLKTSIFLFLGSIYLGVNGT